MRLLRRVVSDIAGPRLYTGPPAAMLSGTPDQMRADVRRAVDGERIMRAVLSVFPRPHCMGGAPHHDAWGWLAAHGEALSLLAGLWVPGHFQRTQKLQVPGWGAVRDALRVRRRRLLEAALLFEVAACGPRGLQDLLITSSAPPPGGSLAPMQLRAMRYVLVGLPPVVCEPWLLRQRERNKVRERKKQRETEVER